MSRRWPVQPRLMLDLREAAARIAEAKAVLLDWDGCLATGGALLPGARDLLQLVGARAYILSNNSTDQPGDFQGFLAAEGVPFDAERIFLAGHETLRSLAASDRDRRIHLVASPAMTTFASSLGVKTTRSSPDAVVILRDTNFTFDKLEAAANAARRCRRVMLANPDLTHPGRNGAVVPETGSLWAAIKACLGPARIKLEVIGKPGPLLFQQALTRAGIGPEAAVMLGDNPLTDGLGARAAAIPFMRIGPDEGVSMARLAPVVAGLEAARSPSRIARSARP